MMKGTSVLDVPFVFCANGSLPVFPMSWNPSLDDASVLVQFLYVISLHPYPVHWRGWLYRNHGRRHCRCDDKRESHCRPRWRGDGMRPVHWRRSMMPMVVMCECGERHCRCQQQRRYRLCCRFHCVDVCVHFNLLYGHTC